jgi:2-octaprenyl-6-methoxyphenol hydroxylase
MARTVAARMVVAADGRNSTMREALGIPVKTLRYGQKALAFAVTHPDAAWQCLDRDPPLGRAVHAGPAARPRGRPSSAIVWMETGPEVARLAALPVAEFEAAINTRSCGILGPLTLASRRTVWPIISQIAARMAGERTALMAEAAHVVPPIGAQGLNMSLADLRVLLDLAAQDPADLGSARCWKPITAPPLRGAGCASPASTR